MSFQDDEGESSPAGTARCRHGKVSPSLLPLGQEEVGGEVLGGVDVVLGHEAGASLEYNRLVQVIVMSNGGDGGSNGAIPAE